MRIDINPITSKQNNEFVVFYDENLEYKAILPPVTISDPLYVEKIDDIVLYNSENIQEYKTHTDYIKNIKQDNIPLKFVLNNTAEINQIVFESSNNTYRVYYEENRGINKYILEHNDKFFHIYPVEDGVIRHLPIYDKDIQIGEALSLSDRNKGNDEYRCFLKEEYCYIADGISCLLLFMDRNEYSSCYMVNGQPMNSGNKEKHPYYDKSWLVNNFMNDLSKDKVDDNDDYEEEDTNNEVVNVDKVKKPSTNKTLLIIAIAWIAVILLLIIAVIFFI